MTFERYVRTAVSIAEQARVALVLPGEPRQRQLQLARNCIRLARTARRLGRIPTADEKLRVIQNDLQPYEL